MEKKSILGVALTHVQDLTLGLVELHDVHMALLLKGGCNT